MKKSVWNDKKVSKDPLAIPEFLRTTTAGTPCQSVAKEEGIIDRRYAILDDSFYPARELFPMGDADRILVTAMIDQASRNSEEQREIRRQERAERKAAARDPGIDARKAKRATMVAINVIAKDLGIIPREARGALRNLKWEKPSWGWAFAPEAVDEVKKAITGALHQQSKEKNDVKRSSKSKTAEVHNREDDGGRRGKRSVQRTDKPGRRDARGVRQHAGKPAAKRRGAKARGRR